MHLFMLVDILPNVLLFQVMMDVMNFILTRDIPDIPVSPCLQR